jgi:hypothetical protein
MPFKPGDPTINRKGRPKKDEGMTDILRAAGLKADVMSNGTKIERRQALAEALWQSALIDKNLASIKYIYDRLEGMPRASVDMDLNGQIEGITVAIVDRTCNRAAE